MNDWIEDFIPVTLASGEPVLACPVCGDEYVRPIGLECISPGREFGRLRVDHQGVHLDPTSAPAGRGVMIMLQLACESGHKFDYEFQFYKGNTLVRCLPRPQLKSPEEPAIWRN